jgi:hypothetical protein
VAIAIKKQQTTKKVYFVEKQVDVSDTFSREQKGDCQ